MTEQPNLPGYADELAHVFVSGPEDTRQEGFLECLRGDFADLGAEETLRQARQAEQILRGFMTAMEDINLPLYLAFGRAYALVKEARERAEAYASRR